MSVYARYVLPRLIDAVMQNPASAAERARVVPQAAGVVLEIGTGSAHNLRFLGPAVTRVYALDPSLPLWRLGRARLATARVPVRFIAASAERIPLRDATIDTVLSTWTLCSIPDVAAAVREIRRVLRPTGRFVFIEHGRAPDPRVVAWQDRVDLLWKRLAGGCHTNRKIDALIERGGLRLISLDASYGDGPRLFSYLYRGAAEPIV